MFNVEIYWNVDAGVQKIFSAFYPTLHERFSNSYGFFLWQEFNIFYPHLVIYDRKHFCSVLTDLSNLLEWMFLPNSFQKCRSSRSRLFFRSSRPEMFCKKAVLRDFLKSTRKHMFHSLRPRSRPGQVRQLYLKRDPVSWCFLWILRNLKEHLFLRNTSRGCF